MRPVPPAVTAIVGRVAWLPTGASVAAVARAGELLCAFGAAERGATSTAAAVAR